MTDGIVEAPPLARLRKPHNASWAACCRRERVLPNDQKRIDVALRPVV